MLMDFLITISNIHSLDFEQCKYFITIKESKNVLSIWMIAN